jgi:hypothetical protein
MGDQNFVNEMKEYRGVDFIKLEFNDNAVYGGIDPSFL